MSARRGSVTAVLFGIAAVVAILGTVRPAGALELDLRKVRSYGIPAQFSLDNAIVETDGEGTTLIAATTGAGAMAACTVVVASPDAARAYAYRHHDQGSKCVGALLHPEGGFFVRGFGADASEGDVAGFTARIDASGREQWLRTDVEIARSSDFRGSYRRPHPVMAFSPERNRLLEFSTGTLRLGMLDERDVTYASVLREGRLQVEAQALGESSGLGIIGGAVTLEESGTFLVFVYRPATQGARLLTYDGRASVDAYEPLDEDWSDRFVRQMVYGPDGHVYLLWTEDRKGGGPTRVTVADTSGAGVWSNSYPASAEIGGEERSLGPPRGIWVGSSRVVVLYRANGRFLRVLGAEDGGERGLVQFAGELEARPLQIVSGPEGDLRLLAADTAANRFREMKLVFRPDGAGGDAGTIDGGLPEVGPDGGPSGDLRNGGGSGGCSSVGAGEPAGPVPPPGFALAVALAACCAVLRRR